MLKILTFSTLYPNPAQPYHGIFVEERVRRIAASGAASVHVVAPVPWFPFGHSRFGTYAKFAAVPRNETRHGLAIDHPRFPVIPKIGMNVAPKLMVGALANGIKRLHAQYRFDLIDAHYYYPDGVAASAIARRLDIPLVITARGSDIHILPGFPIPRAQVLAAARTAAANITVSQALKDTMVGLGVPEANVVVLRNGVDLARFRLFDEGERDAARHALGFHRATIVSVGELIPLKGHDITIRALTELGDTELVIVGEGPQASALQTLAKRVGVADRVRFAGRKTHDELVQFYNAADCTVLASSTEGMPNALLESLACGTPALATRVGGVGEIVAAPEAGRLITERTPEALAHGFRELMKERSPRPAVRRYAERFGWDTIIARQLEVFAQAAGR